MILLLYGMHQRARLVRYEILMGESWNNNLRNHPERKKKKNAPHFYEKKKRYQVQSASVRWIVLRSGVVAWFVSYVSNYKKCDLCNVLLIELYCTETGAGPGEAGRDSTSKGDSATAPIAACSGRTRSSPPGLPRDRAGSSHSTQARFLEISK